VVNVFGGVLCAAATLYLIAKHDDDDDDPLSGLLSFLKWFVTVYSSALWAGLAAWSWLSRALDPWLEELKTWLVAVVGVTFFVVIHVDLEVPFTTEAWRWAVYGLLALLQLAISAVVSRAAPMVAGAVCLFVLAWKLAFEAAELAGVRSGELRALVTLATLALQGVGVLVAAIFYAGNSDKVDDAVLEPLCGGSRCARSPELQEPGVQAA